MLRKYGNQKQQAELLPRLATDTVRARGTLEAAAAH